MSLYINRFIDRIRAAENRQQRDLIMTVAEARDLHGDITKLLLVIEELRGRDQPAVIETIEVEGGSF